MVSWNTSFAFLILFDLMKHTSLRFRVSFICKIKTGKIKMARSFCEVCHFSCFIDKITGRRDKAERLLGAGGIVYTFSTLRRQRQLGLLVRGQPGLQNECQDSQDHIDKSCLKKQRGEGGRGGELILTQFEGLVRVQKSHWGSMKELVTLYLQS